MSDLEGPNDAPLVVLGNPIGTSRAIWDAQARVLVIAGAEDPAAPPWQAAMTASGITRSRLRVIRGTSHLAPYQTPGPVTDSILTHLRRTLG